MLRDLVRLQSLNNCQPSEFLIIRLITPICVIHYVIDELSIFSDVIEYVGKEVIIYR
jgi:hypothetical protein